MTTYRIRLSLHGAIGTPLSADTLWGHVCWGLVYHEGEQALERFLAEMASENPPIVLSDPLPAGMFPLPTVPLRVSQVLNDTDRLENSVKRKLLERFDQLANVKRHSWVSRRTMEKLVDGLSSEALMEEFGRAQPQQLDVPRQVTVPVAHNTIDRLTNHTSAEGGLYFSQETFFDGPPNYDVWVRSPLSADRCRELFSWGLEGGYGRDASTGKGRLVVDGIEVAELPGAKQPNALMTLGPCAPAEKDPTHGFWTIESRLGKLGGAWASELDEGSGGGVFKYPVIFLARGAVFMGESRPFLGRMIPGVHPTRPQVVQYGLALTIPVRLSDLLGV